MLDIVVGDQESPLKLTTESLLELPGGGIDGVLPIDTTDSARCSFLSQLQPDWSPTGISDCPVALPGASLNHLAGFAGDDGSANLLSTTGAMDYSSISGSSSCTATASELPVTHTVLNSTSTGTGSGGPNPGFRVGWTKASGESSRWLVVDVGVGAVDPKTALHGPFRIASNSTMLDSDMNIHRSDAAELPVAEEDPILQVGGAATACTTDYATGSTAAVGLSALPEARKGASSGSPQQQQQRGRRADRDEGGDDDDEDGGGGGGGKPAVTLFRLLRTIRQPSSDGVGGDVIHSIVEARPLTGRTHQIRVHLAWLGFPIADDPLYCKAAREDVNKAAAAAAAVSASTSTSHETVGEGGVASDTPSVLSTGVEASANAATAAAHLLCHSCATGDDAAELTPMHTHCSRISLHSCTYEGRGWRFDCPAELLPDWTVGAGAERWTG
jgi:hypothetical protein